MKFNENVLLLYAVTNRAYARGQTLYEQVEEALKGGVTILQLREKDLEYDDYLSEAKEICELCHRYNVPFIVNDNVDIALKSGADGVHVGAEDLPVSRIRKIVPEDFIIGATAKTVEQAVAAQTGGADYIGVGAVFPSPTKKNAVRITTEKLKEICDSTSLPAVAIGGITSENALEIEGCGVKGIAVVSAIFGAENVIEATVAIKEKAKRVVAKSGEKE